MAQAKGSPTHSLASKSEATAQGWIGTFMVLVRSQVVLTDRRDIDGEGTEDVLVSWASPIRTARAKRARHTSYSDGPQA